MEPPDRGKKKGDQKQTKGCSKSIQNTRKGVSYSDYPKLGSTVPSKGHSKTKTAKKVLPTEVVYHQKSHVESIIHL